MLRYANYAKVADALQVSRAAVADWAKGRSVTPYRVNQLEQLLRPDLDIEKRPPGWAEGLVADVDAIRRGVESEAIGLAALRALIESTQSLLLPPDADPVDAPAPPQKARRRGR
jgi:transcriptional regulator with XRE-family HTH domain